MPRAVDAAARLTVLIEVFWLCAMAIQVLRCPVAVQVVHKEFHSCNSHPKHAGIVQQPPSWCWFSAKSLNSQPTVSVSKFPPKTRSGQYCLPPTPPPPALPNLCLASTAATIDALSFLTSPPGPLALGDDNTLLATPLPFPPTAPLGDAMLLALLEPSAAVDAVPAAAMLSPGGRSNLPCCCCCCSGAWLLLVLAEPPGCCCARFAITAAIREALSDPPPANDPARLTAAL